MPPSAQFIGDMSLIPTRLRRWEALYVDPRQQQAPSGFLHFAVRFFSEALSTLPRVLHPPFVHPAQ